jgi:hypothetical protein
LGGIKNKLAFLNLVFDYFTILCELFKVYKKRKQKSPFSLAALTPRKGLSIMSLLIYFSYGIPPHFLFFHQAEVPTTFQYLQISSFHLIVAIFLESLPF